MKRADVSFTFLSRIDEIELNIKDNRWQSALALALTLPDICGGIAFPDIVKRYRDGRIILDQNNRPTRDVGNQYIRWFDEYAGNYFKISPKDASPYICGKLCWQLRCEYLHQNKGFANDNASDTVHFHLGINCKTSVCQLNNDTFRPNQTDIRIDIEQFCQRMCRAAKSYYYAVYHQKDFSLYNTPVLDFIQAQRDAKTNPLIAIACGSPTYAEGLRMALERISNQIVIYTDAASFEATVKKRRPILWVVTEEQLDKPEKPWLTNTSTPIILLAASSKKNAFIQKNPKKLTTLILPVSPAVLRNAVNQYLL